MHEWGAAGTPASMSLAFKAATKDVVSNYAFGEGASNSLNEADLDIAYFESLPHDPSLFFAQYFHWISVLMTKLPVAVVISLNPPLAVFIKFVEVS